MTVSQLRSQGKRSASSALKLAALVGLGLALPQSSHAGQIFWADGSDEERNWSEPSNWSPATVPGATDFVVLDNTDPTGKTALVNSNVGTVQTVYVQSGNELRIESGGDLTVHNPDRVTPVDNDDVANLGVIGVFDQGIRIGDGYLATGGGVGSAVVTGTGKLTMNSDNFASFMRIGVSGGTGTLTQDGGEISIARDIMVGDGMSFNEGANTISGAGSTGTFNQSAGTTTSGWSFVGLNGGSGTYNLSGGTRTVNGWHVVGRTGGTGTFNMTGGTLASGDLRVGQDAGSNGTVNQSNGTITNNDNGTWAFVGAAGGTGEYNLSGGSLSYTGGDARLNIGDGAGSRGTFNQTGGTMTTKWGMVGVAGGTGEYNHSAGTVSTHGWMRIAEGNGTTGNYRLSGNAVLDIGTEGTPDAGLFQDNLLYVGVGAGETAATAARGGLEIRDSAVANVSNGMLVGAEGGTGTVTQTGGTVTINNFASIGHSEGAFDPDGSGGPIAPFAPTSGIGTYTISAGSLSVANDLNVGDNGNTTGTLNLSGTGTVSGGNVFVGKSPNSTGTVNQTGGTFTAGAGGIMIARDAGSTGTYNLQGGVLNASGSALNFGAGTADFNMTGGRLADASAINFFLDQQGGTLAPGAGIGITTIDGDGTNAYTLGSLGTLEIELDGTGFDQLLVNDGLVSLLGNLDLIAGPGLAGGEYVILSNDGTDAITGMFAGRTEGSTFSEDGYEFTISYLGGDGNDVALTLVPEPTSLALLGIGAMGLLARRRRNNAA